MDMQSGGKVGRHGKGVGKAKSGKADSRSPPAQNRNDTQPHGGKNVNCKGGKAKDEFFCPVDQSFYKDHGGKGSNGKNGKTPVEQSYYTEMWTTVFENLLIPTHKRKQQHQ